MAWIERERAYDAAAYNKQDVEKKMHWMVALTIHIYYRYYWMYLYIRYTRICTLYSYIHPAIHASTSLPIPWLTINDMLRLCLWGFSLFYVVRIRLLRIFRSSWARCWCCSRSYLPNGGGSTFSFIWKLCSEENIGYVRHRYCFLLWRVIQFHMQESLAIDGDWCEARAHSICVVFVLCSNGMVSTVWYGGWNA